jgi:membrane protease YdiL (CAAX protease family)
MHTPLDVAAPLGAPPRVGFGVRFWPLFLIGLAGVATLPFLLVPLIRSGGLPPGVPDLPLPVLVGLSMINPVLYLAGGAALGAWLAPGLGLRSLMVERAQTGSPLGPALGASAPLALGTGLGLAVLTASLDLLFQPLLSEEWTRAAAEQPASGELSALLPGLLYGGITEEIVLRWGMLTLFAWIGWRLLQKGRRTPSAMVMWTAIVLAALLFGLGHLPAAAAIAPLDPILVLRTVSLNALAGIFFGWLFWRRHLEAAMLAHASAHIGFALLAWVGPG